MKQLYAVIVVDRMARARADEVMLSLHPSLIDAERSVIEEAQEAYDEEATGLPSGADVEEELGQRPNTYDTATEFLGYQGDDFDCEIRPVVVTPARRKQKAWRSRRQPR